MIRPGEIQKKANRLGVRDPQIEKDYILSWILQGIAQHEQLSETIVFKGGTLLKKVYFEDYRFSEDLDFTLLNTDISNDQLFEWFTESFEYALDRANLQLKIMDNNEHADGGINFYISYGGPLGGVGVHKKVKVDISKSERLQFKPVCKAVFISYSDQEAHKLLCYPLEEVLIEKMRSVMQRMQPRDFYDIWYLLEQHGMDLSDYVVEFRTKCDNKGIDPSGFHLKFEQRLPQYRGRWETSMADQIQNLPAFEKVERAVRRQLRKVTPAPK